MSAFYFMSIFGKVNDYLSLLAGPNSWIRVRVVFSFLGIKNENSGTGI